MKRLLTYLSIGCLSLVSTIDALAQCPVSAAASTINVTCGDTVRLSASGSPATYVFNNNFDAGTVGTGWASTSSAVFTNPCGTGPSGNTTKHLWFGSSSTAPRNATTNNFNFTTGGTISFWMKYATQGGPGSCEGIDLPDEGVHVQYSNNGGGSWTDIQYYSPNGGNDPLMTSWQFYSLTIPPAAMTANTRIRWAQTVSSNSGSDHWGLEDTRIAVNDPAYKYDWTHDALVPATSAFTPPVVPTTNTTYTVSYSDGITTCTSKVSVNVLFPTTTASVSTGSICPGSPISLDVTSQLKGVAPTSCAVVASPACTPFSTVADEKKVGTGTGIYSDTDDTPFSEFGFSYGKTTNILYRAANLTAAGMVAGKITSLAFDVGVITDGFDNFTSVSYSNFQISMGCAGTSATQQMATFSNPAVTLSTVFNTKTVTMNLGQNYFFFDQGYDWDGVSNIVVRICWKVPSSTADVFALANFSSPGYNCMYTYGIFTSEALCFQDNSFGYLRNTRPNTYFGFCRSNNATLTYNWVSVPAGFSSTAKNPTTNPGTTSSYTVTVNQVGRPAGCAVTSNAVVVNVVATAASVTPTSATVCPTTSPTVALAANGVTSGTYSGPVIYNNTTTSIIPNGNATGVSSPLEVQGVTANITTQLVSVCVNITEGRNADMTLRLTAPNGSSVLLKSAAIGNGANMTNTCYRTGSPAMANGGAPYTGNFAPNQAFSGLTGVANGIWTLTAIDNIATGVNGTINNWSMTFNTTSNGVVKYQWINTILGLSNVNISTPVAQPVLPTTYTVRVTDALGCTATQTVVVDYCGALPVNIISLDAYKTSTGNKVVWATAQEENNAQFQIERSNDGVNFFGLGVVAGAGTSNIRHDYSFVDKYPAPGINYYRLKQTDFDGKSEYTRVVSVFYSESGLGMLLESLSPIPAEDVLNFVIQLPTDDEVDMQILDMSGKIFYAEKYKYNSGRNDGNVDVSQLAAGVYMLRVQKSDGTSMAKRFVK